MIILLQIFHKMCQWKNFKNRPIVAKTNVWSLLLVHPVYAPVEMRLSAGRCSDPLLGAYNAPAGSLVAFGKEKQNG